MDLMENGLSNLKVGINKASSGRKIKHSSKVFKIRVEMTRKIFCFQNGIITFTGSCINIVLLKSGSCRGSFSFDDFV